MANDSKPALDTWKKPAAKEAGKDAAELAVTTAEGIRIKPLYTVDDLPGAALAATPGVEPFARGPHATMYSQPPWTIRQYAGFSTARESNTFYRRNLAQGQK